MPELLNEHFDVEPYYERTRKVVNKKTGEVHEIIEEVATDFPTIASFAHKIGVSRKTIYEWAKKYPEFGESVRRAKDSQEMFITINGLKGLVNSTFAIFTAKNVLKWRDKQPDEAPDVQVNNNVNAIDDIKLKKLIKIARGDK